MPFVTQAKMSNKYALRYDGILCFCASLFAISPLNKIAMVLLATKTVNIDAMPAITNSALVFVILLSSISLCNAF
ncbi:Uncharacterised protein [Wolbachia endosymbiont wPip_Mol of Culex molestus]|nr:Uncharacterised protein [Wolbachia endosymbiont wPip_Mol of Culex molestus]